MKRRLAYISPLPPTQTGVADYSVEFLPYLAAEADLVLFTESPAGAPPALHQQFPIYELGQYPAMRWQFEATLYHIGNNHHHEAIYRLFCQYPGIAVMHDYFLHPFLGARSQAKGGYSLYRRELGYTYSLEGVRLGWDVEMGGQPIPHTVVPLNERVLDLSLGVIVHSEFAANLARGLSRPVQAIPLFLKPYPATSQRAQLPWPADTIVFATVGYLPLTKNAHPILRVFGRLRQSHPKTAYLFVGQTNDFEQDRLAAWTKEFGLEGWVHQVGYLPDLTDFLNWVATADVIMGLRYPTMGEASATVLRAFGLSRPVIVSDHGWYGELPNEICCKVPPGDEDALLETMRRLADSPTLRQELGRAANHYAETVLAPAGIARAYSQFVEKIIYGGS